MSVIAMLHHMKLLGLVLHAIVVVLNSTTYLQV
jgi:hypothetical protein